MSSVKVSSRLQPLFATLRSWVTGPLTRSILFIVCILMWMVRVAWRRRHDPLQDIPRPSFWQRFPLYRLYIYLSGQGHKQLLSLHRQLGPVVRLDDNVVVFDDADAYRAVYGNPKFLKSQFYDNIIAPSENVFTTRSREFHKKRKALLSPFYGMQALKAAEPFVREFGIDVLVEKMKHLAGTGKVVNMMPEFQNMAFDVIGILAFGKRFNLLHGEPHPILQWTLSTMRYIILHSVFGRWTPLLGFPSRNAELAEFTKSAIEERRRQGVKDDVFEMLVSARDEDGHGLSEDALVSEMVTQLVAGADTTSIMLSWSLYLLMIHPKAMERLHMELRTVVSADLSQLTYAAVEPLPYLDAVINEAFRYRGVASGLAPRTVPSGGFNLLGYCLPEGTVVSGAGYTVHHNTKYFDHPEVFDPDRWFIKDEKKLAAMRKALIPFSIGPRACLGRNLAWLELKLTLSALIRKFRFQHVPGADMSPQEILILRPKGLHVDAKVFARDDA